MTQVRRYVNSCEYNQIHFICNNAFCICSMSSLFWKPDVDSVARFPFWAVWMCNGCSRISVSADLTTDTRVSAGLTAVWKPQKVVFTLTCSLFFLLLIQVKMESDTSLFSCSSSLLNQFTLENSQFEVQFIHRKMNWFMITAHFLLGWYLVNSWWSRIIDPDLHLHILTVSVSCYWSRIKTCCLFSRCLAARGQQNNVTMSIKIIIIIIITRDNIIYI